MTVSGKVKVTAAAVVVKVDDPRKQVYLYRGATVPPEARAGEAERLVKRGLARVDAPAARPAPAAEPEPKGEEPAYVEESVVVENDADSLDGLTVAQLKAHLTALGIPFDGVTAKADLLALAQQ